MSNPVETTREFNRDGVTFVIEQQEYAGGYGVKTLRFDATHSEDKSGKKLLLGYATIYKAKSAASNTASVELAKWHTGTKGTTTVDNFDADNYARNTGYGDESIIALGLALIQRAKTKWA